MSNSPDDPRKELRERGRFALVFVFAQGALFAMFLLFTWPRLTGHTPR